MQLASNDGDSGAKLAGYYIAGTFSAATVLYPSSTLSYMDTSLTKCGHVALRISILIQYCLDRFSNFFRC